jgi:hypothetical protein
MQEQFNPEVRRGALVFPGSSIVAHDFIALGLFSRADSWLNLVRQGTPKAWREGPTLDTHDYRHVLVARAVTDGEALDLVLRPADGGGRVEIDIARLLPGRAYTVHGAVDASVTPDDNGRARVAVDLDGRREVRLEPGT